MYPTVMAEFYQRHPSSEGTDLSIGETPKLTWSLVLCQVFHLLYNLFLWNFYGLDKTRLGIHWVVFMIV